ncbi:lipase 3-like [Ostrinia nubilalis]|uniref:lipase 3-like n=1 Tax=Ostrinia nubilalis TaxID=29057 RepID=UPI00308239EB
MVCVVYAQLPIRDTSASVPQSIAAAGYPVEKHRTRTEDGYILQIFRIPGGKKSPGRSGNTNTKRKGAVVLFHGLFGYSGNFIVLGPEQSLGYFLADAGYDVWLANLRGTVYSAHQNLSKSDMTFWDFSFHEHGKYDAPAIIDKILSVTGLPRLLYIGYSMGTTTFFTMMAQRPEYNQKIIAFVGLATGVYLDNIRPLINFVQSIDLLNILRQRGHNGIAVSQETLTYISSSFCNNLQPLSDICTKLAYAVVGDDYEQRRWDMMILFLTTMQPASFRQIEHFGKIAQTSVFTSWEDGLGRPGAEGRVKPYNLTNVRVPVTLIYGENDQLTEKSQIKRLAEELKATGTLESITACPWPKFNHLDFLFAKDVASILNKPVVKLVNDLFSKYYK